MNLAGAIAMLPEGWWVHVIIAVALGCFVLKVRDDLREGARLRQGRARESFAQGRRPNDSFRQARLNRASATQPLSAWDRDMARLRDDVEKAVRDGTYDLAVADRFDAEFKRLDDELLAATRSSRREWFFLTGMSLVLIGVVLQRAMGDAFVYFHRDILMIAGICVALPAMGVASYKLTGTQMIKFERWKSRWVAVLFLMVVSTFGLMLCLLGWVAATGRLVGVPVQIETRVLVLDSSSLRCRRALTLAVNDELSSICADGKTDNAPFTVGQIIRVTGKRSALGLYVQRIDG